MWVTSYYLLHDLRVNFQNTSYELQIVVGGILNNKLRVVSYDLLVIPQITSYC